MAFKDLLTRRKLLKDVENLVEQRTDISALN